MKDLLLGYKENIVEKYNDAFIYGRKDEHALQAVINAFKLLEAIPQVKIRSITMETDESTFGPIRQQGKLYKAMLPSRLNKIHYIIDIEGRANPIEKDLYICKTTEGGFYINEGKKYNLVYQIIENVCTATDKVIMMHILNFPQTILRKEVYIKDIFDKHEVAVNVFEPLIFKKKVPLIYFIMNKLALTLSKELNIDPNVSAEIFNDTKDIKLIDMINDWFNVDLEFNDEPDPLVKEGRVVFGVNNGKVAGVYFSLPEYQIHTQMGRIVIGMLMEARAPQEKRKKAAFVYNDIISPSFWIRTYSQFFIGETNPIHKRFNKCRDLDASVGRILDQTTKDILFIPEEDKKDFYSLIMHLVENYEMYLAQDANSWDYKRIRSYEYIAYALRIYLSQKVNDIMLEANFSVQNIERIFSSLSPMYLIKNSLQKTTSADHDNGQGTDASLIRYVNGTNQMDLFTVLLAYSFEGPQGVSSNVSKLQRDWHPSATGRAGRFTCSPQNPGIIGNLNPRLKTYNGGFFEPQTPDAEQDKWD